MTRAVKLSTADIRERETSKVIPARLPLRVINLSAKQMRATYSSIDELAESILSRGQLQQGIAAALTPKEAQKYVREMNMLWGTNQHISEFQAAELDGERMYIILIAGHRRYKAVEIAEGKAEHDLGYRVELRFGISAEDALSVQFTENMHEKVPPHEEAKAIHLGWLWIKRKHPRISLAQFARSLNRSSDSVKGALRFVSLPESIQQFAYDGKLAYSLLLGVARYAEGMEGMGKPLDEKELTSFAEYAMIEQLRSKDLEKIVTSRLAHAACGQLSLFEEAEVGKQRPLRKAAAEHLIRGCMLYIGYLQALSRHRKDGGFEGQSHWEPETDPDVFALFVPDSPVRMLLRMSQYLADELPHFEELARRFKLPQQEQVALRKVVRRIPQVVERVGELASLEG